MLQVVLKLRRPYVSQNNAEELNEMETLLLEKHESLKHVLRTAIASSIAPRFVHGLASNAQP